MATGKVRIEWVDIAKFLCIICVIVTHLESNTEFLSLFYSPFMLTVFFFVSGYVYNPKYSFGEMLWKKISTLLVPWLFFSIFNILTSQLLSFNEHGSIVEELWWNFLQIRGKGDGLWFVAALFVAFIPFWHIINRYIKCGGNEKQKIIAVIGIAALLYLCSILYEKYMNPTLLPWDSSALPWHLEYIFQAMLFMVLGYLFRVRFEAILDTWLTDSRYALLCGGYLVCAFLPYTADVDGDIFYEILIKLMGIVAVVYGCKKVKSNRFVRFVGQNTLIYFALHGKVYSALQTVIRLAAGNTYQRILDNVLCSSIFAVLLAMIVALVLIIPTIIIRKWFPFILGQSKSVLRVR